MTEAEVLALFESCSNAGSWDADDELGTANYITAENRIAAARLVRAGRAVSLARDLSQVPSQANPNPLVHRMLFSPISDPIGCLDAFEVAPHSFAITHLDAVGHIFFEGTLYKGRRAAEVVTAKGLGFASILALKQGIVTRGILLDVAAARNIPWLGAGEGVDPEDLDAAERLSGVRVGPGDAIFVRVGLGAREAVEGEEDPTLRAGLTPRCLPWLHERKVAVYSGDCVEQIPSPYSRVPLPLHQVGVVAMGLVMLDNPALEELTVVVRELNRSEFMLVCAPLTIPGGTGSPLNPIAIF
jgi:kynurenine formamidase